MHPLFLRVGVPLAGVAIITVAWYRFGWQGVAVVATAIVMWALLHFNRMMQVLKRAANRPIGYVDSAVMLNARLKPG
nr:glycerate kinase [Rhodoferax sp.]